MAQATELVELPPPPKRPGRVDWNEVLDGRVWKLKCGVDFDNENGKAIRSKARRMANARGIEVDTRPPVKEGREVFVYVQAKRTDGSSPRLWQ